ncbi:MAG: hypothetical protein AAGB10_02200 [Pseudomonadota bacterium]
MRIWWIAALLATPVAASTAMTGAEFEAFSTGKTLEFGRGGAWYGSEQYLADRQVIWQYADGSCTYGAWFERDGALCFVYEDNPTPQCWIVSERQSTLFVRPEAASPGDPSELRMTGEIEEPLNCPGPDLGV